MWSACNLLIYCLPSFLFFFLFSFLIKYGNKHYSKIEHLKLGRKCNPALETGICLYWKHADRAGRQDGETENHLKRQGQSQCQHSFHDSELTHKCSPSWQYEGSGGACTWLQQLQSENIMHIQISHTHTHTHICKSLKFMSEFWLHLVIYRLVIPVYYERQHKHCWEWQKEGNSQQKHTFRFKSYDITKS